VRVTRLTSSAYPTYAHQGIPSSQPCNTPGCVTSESVPACSSNVGPEGMRGANVRPPCRVSKPDQGPYARLFDRDGAGVIPEMQPPALPKPCRPRTSSGYAWSPSRRSCSSGGHGGGHRTGWFWLLLAGVGVG
jgi:hypothetical protein